MTLSVFASACSRESAEGDLLGDAAVPFPSCSSNMRGCGRTGRPIARRTTASGSVGAGQRASPRRSPAQPDPGRSTIRFEPSPALGFIRKRRFLHLQRISSNISSFGRIASVGPSQAVPAPAALLKAHSPSVCVSHSLPIPSRHPVWGRLCSTKIGNFTDRSK
jgi:hypothetical protein